LNDHEWPKQSLKVITFENNQITHISSFPNMTVTKVSFYNNKVKTIENKAFKLLSNLTELDLSHNLLTCENFMPDALEVRSPDFFFNLLNVCIISSVNYLFIIYIYKINIGLLI
jgi:Leucine-rich repeat (LRR) protein